MGRNPSPRPWWWLAAGSAATRPEQLSCPWCGSPAEAVPWHPDSSVLSTIGSETLGSDGSGGDKAGRDGDELGEPPEPRVRAAAGIAFTRASCLLGHWFLAPAGCGSQQPQPGRSRRRAHPPGPLPHPRPSGDRGRR